ncbi:VOC family protein [Hoeflea poritis]|uniref:VOC family protein n=1 Tax=Hoeflea poritis TaxID=2993659 RepID=A0ABT4VUF8_9HYPH|nr:VOC family protein [Hoeflea poritis]MDA4847613.1 VOC family protein [Hoeflea poritis]
MIKLDHLTVIAPSLAEGVSHIRDCLGLDVPFGTRHDYMGTHNHRLQLGSSVYLEIVALDPGGVAPPRPRWFGLDNQEAVRADWDEGRRFRGWVASTVDINGANANHRGAFGDKVSLPFSDPEFGFSIPPYGSLPMDGAYPSLIDHRGNPTLMAEIPDLGARLLSITLEHPDPAALQAAYRELAVDRPPMIVSGEKIRYRAKIETPAGLKELT